MRTVESGKPGGDFLYQQLNRDPRLGKAVVVARLILAETALDHLRTQEVAELAHKAQHSVLKAIEATFGPEFFPYENEKLGTVDAEKVDKFVAAIKGKGSRNIFKRHGKQALTDDTSQLSSVAQKIRMMQNDVPKYHNTEDLLTDIAIAEAAGFALVLLYAARISGKKIVIKTSENRRAAQGAAILAALCDVPLAIDPRLNCLNYPDKPDSEIIQIVGPSGSVSWERDTINQLEEGDYERIGLGVEEIVREGDYEEEVIGVYETHTQQTNHLDREIFGENPERYREHGFRIVSAPHHSVPMKSGVFS